ncbi:unnamed protein product [Parascedosporium putredinis]|uniref:Methyltransferase domain-containing protein n=1 Tax=Parascedosporium putredinis TaxID=1442378 RepID=A0A9P1M9G4_9PEZI|nr:unnamed protein product [Parascedosporium putredinis]CAI7991912.1 unnamed protein product [Parascedosporium putredinis]
MPINPPEPVDTGKSPSPTASAPGAAASPDWASRSPDPAIEAATEPPEEDEFLEQEYDASSTATTSVTSSVYAHTIEHGRRYRSFKNGRYPVPDDDIEQNREDMKHAMLLELTDGALHYAPIGDDPQLILDIGTGTAGDTYPSARVRGIDLSPSNPSGALKPGGWVELQELHGAPMCDDGTMLPDDPVKALYDLAAQAFLKFGMNVTVTSELEPLLREAGFENIHCVVKKVPIGPWAKDKTLRLVGKYQELAVQDIIPTFAGRPFEALGMSQTESQVMLAMARKGLADLSIHRYFNYYFWFAQKPEEV